MAALVLWKCGFLQVSACKRIAFSHSYVRQKVSLELVRELVTFVQVPRPRVGLINVSC